MRERYTSLCEAVLCGRKVSGACCERHTGSQHIISLSPEPLLTVLAFSEPLDQQRDFSSWPLNQTSLSQKCTLISAEEPLLFPSLKTESVVDFITSPKCAVELASLCDSHYQHIFFSFEVHNKCVNHNQTLFSFHIKVALS